MGSSSIAAVPVTRLADIKIDPAQKKPLGGLNPYSPHFDQIGQQFRRILTEHAGLNRKSRVLDVGCGTGRLAKALTGAVHSYHGLDVHQGFIDYCKTTYRDQDFTYADVRHDEYNPGGTVEPTTYEFPYPARSFDLVCVVAVFNHFYTPWVFQYVRQISRVLRPKGLLVATFLLLNQRSMEVINTRTRTPYLFPHRTDESWHDDGGRPLLNVAHPEEAVRRVCIKSNLMIREPLRYGEWVGSKIALAGPDIIIAQKS